MFPVILLWLKPDSWELASVGRTPAQKVRSEKSGYISPRVCYACLLCNVNSTNKSQLSLTRGGIATQS